MEPLTLDDIARTSDDVAVRKRFDARNVVWLTLLLVFFLFVPLFQFEDAAGDDDLVGLVCAVVNFALVVVLLLIMRDVFRVRRGKGDKAGVMGRFVERHLSATVLTFAIVQYALALSYTREEGWVGWAIILPFLLLGFRLLVAEHLLLHACIVAGAFVTLLLVPASVRKPIPIFISIVLLNGLTLMIALFFSRRMRRDTIAAWTERRTQAREQIRMRDELQYARELQVSMLPERAPQLEWLDVAGVSVPATEVGGDYYDYFVDGGRVALVCGDVAGHGLASGLVLASLRAGFTLLRASLDNPAAVLQRLHDLVAQTSRRRMLATAAVVLLDRDARRATVASAGHPPILVRRNGDVRALELFAPPLGVRLPVDIPQLQLDLAPGDVYVLHSDGVYETRNERDETYGLERLAALVRDHDGASADALRDAIVSDVERFRGTVVQDDDVTVVVARVVA